MKTKESLGPRPRHPNKSISGAVRFLNTNDWSSRRQKNSSIIRIEDEINSRSCLSFLTRRSGRRRLARLPRCAKGRIQWVCHLMPYVALNTDQNPSPSREIFSRSSRIYFVLDPNFPLFSPRVFQQVRLTPPPPLKRWGCLSQSFGLVKDYVIPEP